MRRNVSGAWRRRGGVRWKLDRKWRSRIKRLKARRGFKKKGRTQKWLKGERAGIEREVRSRQTFRKQKWVKSNGKL